VKRGDLVTVALSDDYGKPRPAVIVQSDLFDQHPSLVILPVTSELRDAPLFRIRVEPSDDNGLRTTSQVIVDKPQAVAVERIKRRIGRLSDEAMLAVNRALAVFLGFA